MNSIPPILHTKPKRQQAFTLVELMVVLAVLIVLLGIAIPNVQSLIIKSELNNAQDTTIHTFNRAKNLARDTGVPLSITINANAIQISSNPPQNVPLASVALSTTGGDGNNVVQLDSFGMFAAADVSTAIKITSSRDGTLSRTLTLNNSFGQITGARQ